MNVLQYPMPKMRGYKPIRTGATRLMRVLYGRPSRWFRDGRTQFCGRYEQSSYLALIKAAPVDTHDSYYIFYLSLLRPTRGTILVIGPCFRGNGKNDCVLS